jgi:hypothetical protein
VAAQQAAVTFEAALRQANEGKSEEAMKAFAALSAEASNPYAVIARMRAAGETAKTDIAAGVAAFDALAADVSVDGELRQSARIRAAMLLVDTITLDEMVKRVGDMATPANTWRNSARELLGLAAYRAGDFTKAAAYFQDVALDPQAPEAMRSRAEMIIELARGAEKAK